MSLKVVLGLLSLLIALIGYLPYTRDIYLKKTKPHAISWLVWACLSGIAFGIQVTNNGGAGAWLMGFTMFATFTVFLLSLRYGEKNILTGDWLSLLFAGVAMLLWVVTDNPLASVFLIVLIDAVGGFLPTFRKSYYKPYEETVVIYLLYAISLVLSLLALTDFTLLTALYPASFVLINLGMVIFLGFRRRAISE